MGDKVTLHLDRHQAEALGKLEDSDEIENRSEAGRLAMNVGLSELGYLNGGGDYLPWLFRKVAAACIYVGLGAVAVFYFLPFRFRLIAVAPIVTGLVFLGAANAFEHHHVTEDDLRDRLPFAGGDRA